MAIKKILIVDDSETERAFLHDILAKKGYDIVLAKSGEEGVEKSKADNPDLAGAERFSGDSYHHARRSDQAHPRYHLHHQRPGDG